MIGLLVEKIVHKAAISRPEKEMCGVAGVCLMFLDFSPAD